jgi:hypothetical protein
MPYFRHHSGRLRIPKWTKCFRIPLRLMKPMSTLKLSRSSSDWVQRVGVQVIAPSCHLATRLAGRKRLRQKSVQAQRFDESKAGIHAGDLIAALAGGLSRQKNSADVAVRSTSRRPRNTVVIAVAPSSDASESSSARDRYGPARSSTAGGDGIDRRC